LLIFARTGWSQSFLPVFRDVSSEIGSLGFFRAKKVGSHQFVMFQVMQETPVSITGRMEGKLLQVLVVLPRPLLCTSPTYFLSSPTRP
jgi:hypothetical protein